MSLNKNTWTDLRGSVPIPAYGHEWINKHREMISLLGEGYNSKEIGEKMKRSPKTIDARIEEMRMILGAKNRPHMIYILCKMGIL